VKQVPCLGSPRSTKTPFIAALEGEVTFEVSKLDAGGFEFRMKDKDGKKIIDLTCRNLGSGPPNYTEDDRYFLKVKRLFEAARVTGLEVDKKLTVAESLLDRF